MNYSVSDFLIQIKNAYRASKRNITVSYSKMSFAIGKILEQEGYIKGIEKKKEAKKQKDILFVELLYKNRKPVFSDVEIVSKPSVHIFVGSKDLGSLRGGFGLAILSTSAGVISDKKARKEKIGGELICKIY